MGMNGIIPDTTSMRIPITYLANLLTGGKEKPVISALDRLLAMRAYMRGKSVGGKPNTAALDQVGLTSAQANEMYRYLAIANYEDRFVIPSGHREETINTFEEKSSCGFSFGNGCSDGVSKPTLFGNRRNAVPVDLSQLHAKKKAG
jgi:nitrate reductase beta subunit